MSAPETLTQAREPAGTPEGSGTTALTGWRDVVHRLRRNRLFVIGAATFAVVVAMCLILPMVIPHDPLAVRIGDRLEPPQWFSAGMEGHILGTDPLGRDVLARLMEGGRVSLFVATLVVVITTIIGLVLGLLAGYFGGIVDLVVMRICDLGLAIPTLLLAIAVVAMIGGGIANLVIVLSATSWIMMTRVVRSTVLSVRNIEFVQAAKVFGLSNSWIIFREVLPNTVPQMVITATQAFGGIILTEASMSFLGLGVPEPAASWGGMIANGREYLDTSSWVVVAPGMALMVAVLAVNFIGDGLNDVLNPHVID
jgi:peptide/nickel transport system permease protein